ncbi:MAG: hypothetical protein HY059_02380 [Proteobacteria bacterium]|nr:hypothetical protein [Pseudomonadota bacterium]
MTMRERLARAVIFFKARRIPIFSDLRAASWANWREALKELFVTLFFSLMPLWLGLFIVTILTITTGAWRFIENFASSSDLGILSTSLLGPLLYAMFREEESAGPTSMAPRFPGGLWFVMIVLACCTIATAIYSFTYLSEINVFYDASGRVIKFVDDPTVAMASWILFIVVVFVILFASTIRNSLESESPRMMSNDTQDFVKSFGAAQLAATTGAISPGADAIAAALAADHQEKGDKK